MEVNHDLYISTNDFNQAHKQLRANEHIQIIAKKNHSREWIRITEITKECNDNHLKQKMYDENSILYKHYQNDHDEHFLMFKIDSN